MTTEPIFGNADMAIHEVNNSLLAIIPMCRCADRKFTIQNVNFYKYSLCLCGKIGLLKRVVNILHLLECILGIMLKTYSIAIMWSFWHLKNVFYPDVIVIQDASSVLCNLFLKYRWWSKTTEILWLNPIQVYKIISSSDNISVIFRPTSVFNVD